MECNPHSDKRRQGLDNARPKSHWHPGLHYEMPRYSPRGPHLIRAPRIHAALCPGMHLQEPESPPVVLVVLVAQLIL